jgi:hypothetical protein
MVTFAVVGSLVYVPPSAIELYPTELGSLKSRTPSVPLPATLESDANPLVWPLLKQDAPPTVMEQWIA